MKRQNNRGFALIEILIAMVILANVLLAIFSSVSSGIFVMAGNKNLTTAVLIARTSMNDFIQNRMREPDASKEPVEEHQNFYLTRVTERYENPLMGPMQARKTTITVSWEEREREKDITLTYIFPDM